MPAAVATRYARALADLVTKPGAAADPEHVSADLQLFEEALAASAQLRNVLLSPAVPSVRKRAVVTDLARVLPLSDIVRRFLCVLIDHRRIDVVSGIREAFESVIDERTGVVRVDVASARQLTPGQRDELVRELSRITGKQARPRFSIDPNLIGGVVARVGSTVYDSSVRGQLQDLRARLAGAAS